MKTIKEVLEAHALHYRGMGFESPPKGTLSTETAVATIESILKEVIGADEAYNPGHNQYQDGERIYRNLLRTEQLARAKELLGE